MIAGDLKQFDFKASARCYQLEPIIKILTRGRNALDQIYTNLKEYYQPPLTGPASGLSDRLTITVLSMFARNPKPRGRSSKRATEDLVAWLVLVVIFWSSHGTLH